MIWLVWELIQTLIFYIPSPITHTSVIKIYLVRRATRQLACFLAFISHTLQCTEKTLDILTLSRTPFFWKIALSSYAKCVDLFSNSRKFKNKLRNIFKVRCHKPFNKHRYRDDSYCTKKITPITTCHDSLWLLSCRACGEMDDRSDDSVCKDGQREIVYAWAMDADSRALPEGSYKPLHKYIL